MNIGYVGTDTSSLLNSEYRLAAKPALTWYPGGCPGQWHPASDQHKFRGATDVGFVRSVLGSLIVHCLIANSYDMIPSTFSSTIRSRVTGNACPRGMSEVARTWTGM